VGFGSPPFVFLASGSAQSHASDMTDTTKAAAPLPQMDGAKVADWRVAAMASPTGGCRALLDAGYTKLEMDLVEIEALYREVYERRLTEQKAKAP
jgi:hypothetical protein